MLVSTKKLFDPKLCEDCDPEGKRISWECLSQLRDEGQPVFKLQTPLEEQKEAYQSHDFEALCCETNELIKFEVEIRLSYWNKYGEWQNYSESINIPHRKQYSKAKYYIDINVNRNTILIIPMKVIKKSPVRENPNKHVPRGEYFYNVDPKDKEIRLYYLAGGRWVKK